MPVSLGILGGMGRFTPRADYVEPRRGRVTPRRRLVLLLIAVAAAAVLTAAGTRTQSGEAPSGAPGPDRATAEPPRGADGTLGPGEDDIAARPLPRRATAPGAQEVRALARAYPDRVEDIAVRNGQWALRIDGRWFYWADGRLLGKDLLSRADEFTPIRFYRYYRGPLEVPELPPEFEERLKAILDERESDPPVRHPGFQDALYGIASHAEADAAMSEVEFLGHATRVHPIAVDALSRVENDVRAAAQSDADVAEFLRGLDTVEGYHWRNIAGTRARSFHSYGVAVDLIPSYYGGDFGYWRWAAQAGIEEWWELGPEDRFSVPQPIVDAFERHGFVWGGKWLFFDPIHFEYRPEVFLLSREEER